ADEIANLVPGLFRQGARTGWRGSRSVACGERQAMNEQAIHRAVVQHLRARGVPRLIFLHPANGGERRRTEAAIFQGLGVRAGAADLLLWHSRKSHALELKAEGKYASGLQRQFLSDFERAGGHAACVAGLDSALHQLEAWSLLRGRAM